MDLDCGMMDSNNNQYTLEYLLAFWPYHILCMIKTFRSMDTRGDNVTGLTHVKTRLITVFKLTVS